MTLSLNPHIAHVRNSKTGVTRAVVPGEPLGLDDGAPLVIEYDLAAIDAWRADRRGMWRYRSLLPVWGVESGYADDVGDTPTIRPGRLGDRLDVELHIKQEGGNPSGSFKDRGLAVGVALGLATGAERFCLPTQGNAGVAASLFSARAGIDPPLLYMPVGHRDSVYHRGAALFGAEVRFVGDTIADAGKAMRSDVAADLASGRFRDLSTFFEPGRLEGKKTMGLEIYEHFGTELPRWIIYPTGGGTGLVGIWKAFAELRALAALPDVPLPRMVAVQSSRCPPVVRSFEAGLDHVEPVKSESTLADGLDVPGAIMGHGILTALRESGGTAVAVSDDDIVAAQRELGRHGVSASYEGAATWAALRTLRDAGSVGAGDSVLLLLTAGHLTSAPH